MTVLLLSLGAAAALVLVLLFFLAVRRSPSPPRAAEPAVRVLPEPSGLTAASIGRAIFSERDWHFIRAQQVAGLEKLFLAERKAMGAFWLKETSARISEIRRMHLLNSRFSRDLSPAEEFRLLCRFLYLSASCRLGLVLIHIGGPTAPATFAAHIQRLADTLPAPKGTLTHAPHN